MYTNCYKSNIFLVSGSGDIVCIGPDGKIKWSKNHYDIYESKPIMFGISESPLVVDNMFSCFTRRKEGIDSSV